MPVAVRPLTPTDRNAWEPLWQGYLAFYETILPPAVTDATWARFHDDSEPMWAFGAFASGRLAGIAHIILHRSCWTEGPYCYLQDLFVSDDLRGQGIGRTLIESVRVVARSKGASRLHWLTHETNHSAMLLYDRVAARSGFVQYRIVL